MNIKKLSYLGLFLLQLIILSIFLLLGYKGNKAFEIIALISLIYSLPTLILHWKHVQMSKKLIISQHDNVLKFKFSEKEVEVNKELIKEVVNYSWKDMTHPFVFWRLYSYSEIKIEDIELPRVYSFTKGVKYLEPPNIEITKVAKFWPW